MDHQTHLLKIRKKHQKKLKLLIVINSLNQPGTAYVFIYYHLIWYKPADTKEAWRLDTHLFNAFPLMMTSL